MRNRALKTTRQTTADDVGTLWMMRRGAYTARCALMAWPATWELRVLVDEATLLSESCIRPGEAFALAERWKDRLLDEGWQQIVPRPPQRAAVDDRRFA